MPATDTAPAARSARSRGAARTAWAYRSAPLCGLGFRFAVRCTDRRLGDRIGSVLAPLRAPVPPEHWYGVRVDDDGTAHVDLDGAPVATGVDRRQAVEWVLWDCNRAVASLTGRRLVLHAAAVAHGGSGVVLPGPSGAGKSTLTAALVRAGFGYLSDELVGVEVGSGRLLPYPRALTVKRGSFGVLADLGGAAGDDAATADAWHVAPDAVRPGAASGPCPPTAVVVPRYTPGAAASVLPLSTDRTFLALATSAVNLPAHGAAGTRVLARLAGTCPGYELVFADLAEAVRVLDEVLGR